MHCLRLVYNSYRFDSDVLGLLPLIALGRYSVDVWKLHCMLCMDAVFIYFVVVTICCKGVSAIKIIDIVIVFSTHQC